MKKIILISDTHTYHHALDNDLKALNCDYETTIIHAGDITNVGRTYELSNFLNWFSNLPYKNKIFIAGNHDFCFETTNQIEEEFKQRGVIYLMDEMVEVNGMKIYGSPWQPRFFDWAFNLNRGAEIARKWSLITPNIDILVTHGPPYGILDTTETGMRVGCEELYKKVTEIVPKVHVFGHIHFSYGYMEFNGTSFVNACSLGENYMYQNKPIVLVLDENNNVIDVNPN